MLIINHRSYILILHLKYLALLITTTNIDTTFSSFLKIIILNLRFLMFILFNHKILLIIILIYFIFLYLIISNLICRFFFKAFSLLDRIFKSFFILNANNISSLLLEYLQIIRIKSFNPLKTSFLTQQPKFLSS